MKTSVTLLSVFLFAQLSGAVAQAATLTYSANLSSATEATPNPSTATGIATVIYDDIARTLQFDVSFSGLMGMPINTHIHCCTTDAGVGAAGVAIPTASFVGFPTDVTSGTYSLLLDLTLTSSFNSAFITANGGTVAGAEAMLAYGLANGTAYFNLHTNLYPTGEINGYFSPVPVPAAVWLFGTGLIGLAGVARRRRPH